MKIMLKTTIVSKKLILILSSFTIISLFGVLMIINTNTVVINVGTIVWMELEGGFYGIITDNGARYDPINLGSNYQIRGQRIFFIALKSANQGSFHMWGTIIDIIYIQKI